MRKIKCPECLTCMEYTWVLPDPTRYLFCWFCRVYRIQEDGKFTIVDDPHIKKENDNGNLDLQNNEQES